ncbi:MAG: hypothetical protein OEW52_01380 [Thermoleophilia bacterium]|nr:hypothetical protein [Thermoleophilia bacterium]MDH5279782.1 hypothetical protein [Thermoleophilia bacterium]
MAERLLVEAAWHQRRPLRASAQLERRRHGQPAAVRTRADAVPRELASQSGSRLMLTVSDDCPRARRSFTSCANTSIAPTKMKEDLL